MAISAPGHRREEGDFIALFDDCIITGELLIYRRANAFEIAKGMRPRLSLGNQGFAHLSNRGRITSEFNGFRTGADRITQTGKKMTLTFMNFPSYKDDRVFPQS